jgi:hypothetical protein
MVEKELEPIRKIEVNGFEGINEARYFIGKDSLNSLIDGLRHNFNTTTNNIINTTHSKAEGRFRVGMLLRLSGNPGFLYGKPLWKDADFYLEWAAREGHSLAKGLLDSTLELEAFLNPKGDMVILIKPSKALDEQKE